MPCMSDLRKDKSFLTSLIRERKSVLTIGLDVDPTKLPAVINGDILAFNKTIIDLDIRKSGLKFGKKSFANCEITLFLKDEIKVNSLVMRPILDDLSKFIIDTSFKQSTYFKFYNKKK